MDFVEIVQNYWLTILSSLCAVISVIYNLIHNKKTGNKAGIIALIEKIPSLVTTAESLYGSGKGSAKLDYVLTQLRLYALQNKINISVEDLTANINSVVETTNNVNISKPLPSESTNTSFNDEVSTSKPQDNINI